jgi:hypothetical protein
MSRDNPPNAAKTKNGWGGIRTPGTVTRTAVFKTAALDHSATHPDLLFTVFYSFLLDAVLLVDTRFDT